MNGIVDTVHLENRAFFGTYMAMVSAFPILPPACSVTRVQGSPAQSRACKGRPGRQLLQPRRLSHNKEHASRAGD
eukprot:1798371-Rhodomonas_salina.1